MTSKPRVAPKVAEAQAPFKIKRGPPKGTLVYVKGESGETVEATADVATALGVTEILVIETEELSIWLKKAIAEADRNKPVFVLTAGLETALTVIKASHIPTATLGLTGDFPTTVEELAVWRLQAQVWQVLKAMCINKGVAFFTKGNRNGFKVIATCVKKLNAECGSQFCMYMLPFVMSIMPVTGKHGYFKLISAMVKKWGWESAPETVHVTTTDPADLVECISAEEERFALPARILAFGGKARNAKEEEEEEEDGAEEMDDSSADKLHQATINTWKNLLVEGVSEIGLTVEDCSTALELMPAFEKGVTGEDMPIRGVANPTWGMVAEYIADTMLFGPLANGGARTYELNAITGMHRAQLLLLLAVQEMVHGPDFDPTRETQFCRTLGKDLSAALVNHMNRDWLLRCISPPVIVRDCAKRGKPVPPPLEDKTCSGVDAKFASAVEEEEEDDRRKQHIDLDDEEEEMDSDDSDSDFSPSASDNEEGDDASSSSSSSGEEGEEEEEEDDIDSLGVHSDSSSDDDDDDDDDGPVTVKRKRSKGEPKRFVTQPSKKKAGVPRKQVLVPGRTLAIDKEAEEAEEAGGDACDGDGEEEEEEEEVEESEEEGAAETAEGASASDDVEMSTSEGVDAEVENAEEDASDEEEAEVAPARKAETKHPAAQSCTKNSHVASRKPMPTLKGKAKVSGKAKTASPSKVEAAAPPPKKRSKVATAANAAPAHETPKPKTGLFSLGGFAAFGRLLGN